MRSTTCYLCACCRLIGALALITIFAAAPYRAALAEDEASATEPPIIESDRDHWAYQPLVRPEVPTVDNTSWPRNALDHFILKGIEEAGIAQAPQADRTTIIRRLYFDLVGLPPSPEEVDRFLADEAPDAYERLVDRLLASPHYGERWAQHWLDLARFAETDGFEHDKVRTHAWKYRDWVIAALNDDMPYDQFVRWQLAGDVLEPENSDAALATAFCLSGPDMPDINSQEERKHTLLNELTSTIGAVLLGIQMGCAQCHDHMYDPVSQADFYRLRAFFQPAVNVTKNKSVLRLTSAKSPATESHLMLRGDWRRKGPRVEPAFPRIANAWNIDVEGQTPEEHRAELARWFTRDDHPLTTRVIVNRVWQHHFGRGIAGTPSDFGIQGEWPTHPELLDWLATEFVAEGWRLKSLHRLILTSATYRQASRAAEDGSDADAWQATIDADPENELYSRFPRLRLEGEIVRDAMLAASGSLSTVAGGPGVMPPLPQEMVSTLLRDQWKTSEVETDRYRRSIYVFARRNLRYPIFEVFDRPAADTSCPRRAQSTTAIQSLLMLNSEASLEAARRLASRVWDEAGSDLRQQVEWAFRFALGRKPTPDTHDDAIAFLDQQRSLLVAEDRQSEDLATPLATKPIDDVLAGAALTDLCLALLNSSEFIYVD